MRELSETEIDFRDGISYSYIYVLHWVLWKKIYVSSEYMYICTHWAYSKFCMDYIIL